MTAKPSPAAHLSRAAGASAFGTDPDGYHVGRIGYPDELYDQIFARCRPNPAILEIAAGTGLATEALLAHTPTSLTVVEADAQLSKYLAQRFTAANVTILNGPFPETEIDGHFDLAVTAAAFHWMEPVAALARVQSLLTPGGVWAMWWNSYCNPNMGDPLADAIMPLLKGIALPPSWTEAGHYGLDVPLHTRALLDAGFVNVQHHIIRRDRVLSAAQVRALFASYSFVRALPDTQRDALLDQIDHIVTHEFADAAPNVVMTALYSAAKTR